MPDMQTRYDKVSAYPEVQVTEQMEFLATLQLASLTEWEQDFIPDMLDIWNVSNKAANRFTRPQLENIARLYCKYS